MATSNLYGRGSTGVAGGRSAFGGVPGPIDVPPNIFAQAAGVVPNLGELAKGAGAFAGSEIAGQLSPETMRTLQDQGAAWGIQAGMPGFTPGSLVQNRTLRNLGLSVEDTQRKGTQDFLSILGGVGAAQTPQALAADIASRNALFAAAPDPAAAAAEQERQWMEKFNLTRDAGGRSLNWRDLFNPVGTSIAPSFGTGTPSFIGNPSLGGAPSGPAYGATGPFDTPTAPGRASYTLTGNTLGGGAPHDDVLNAFFNPEDYYWGQPEGGQAQTSGGELGM